MCSSDEVLSYLNAPQQLADFLKEKSDLIIPDSTCILIAKHFLLQPISVEGLAVQRNLFGRSRSSPLDQYEIDLFISNIKGCINSNHEQLTKPFLQYLHNINRLLPSSFQDITYLCALILLSNNNTNVIACILCAYLQMNTFENSRFDLIINGLYKNGEDNPWIHQLTKILIDKDEQWLRKYYLEKLYTKELLHALDTHNQEDIFNVQSIKQDSQQSDLATTQNIDLTEVSSLNDLHSILSSHITNCYPNQTIDETSLLHLLSSSNDYPKDLHTLFSCSLISLINPSNYSKSILRLFRHLIISISNYYINQQDLLDDNRYRLMIVYLVSKFLCEVHRRRSKGEHEWYRLYVDVPKEHPLPTFDLFADLLLLLSTLSYNHNDCQNQVRQVPGTIESVLSMTQIDLNQPKAQACVTWLLRCLTEANQENRDYIKEIK